MSKDRFVTLRHVSSPVDGEMMRDLLAQEGIEATIQGNAHNALLAGLASGALQVPLQVRARDAKRAAAILDALEHFEPVEAAGAEIPKDEDLTDGAGPYRATALTGPGPTRRSKAVAVYAAVLLPFVLGIFGAGHFYVRSYASGFIFLLLGWICVLGGVVWHPAWLGIPIVVAIDAWGARAVAARSE